MLRGFWVDQLDRIKSPTGLLFDRFGQPERSDSGSPYSNTIVYGLKTMHPPLLAPKNDLVLIHQTDSSIISNVSLVSNQRVIEKPDGNFFGN